MKLVSLLILGLLLSATALANPTRGLEPVGAATLKVLFWTIYDSELYSPDGEFSGVEPGLVLAITYRRNIRSNDLVARTSQEWRKLGLPDQDHETWLQQLAALWPDVSKGDSLVLEVDEDLGSRFYRNDDFLGEVKDTDFTRQFLAIWLSRDSSYPDLRDQLLGLAN